MYWAPSLPVPANAYHPICSFNGVTPHFGTQTHAMHLLLSCAAAMAMFWGGVPTAVWLALAIGLVVLRRSKVVDAFSYVPFVLALFAIGMPVMWGILQIPTGIGAKYFNVGILLLALVAVWLLSRAVDLMAPAPRRALCLVMFAAYVGVLALLQPVDFDFCPAWAP